MFFFRVVEFLVEPLAAVRDPPTQEGDRNGCQQSPPNRQHDIRDHAQHRERYPEDFSLHAVILVLMILIALPNFPLAGGQFAFAGLPLYGFAQVFQLEHCVMTILYAQPCY